MIVSFIANTVTVDNSDAEFTFVGFADESGGECREALHFQRSREFTAEDSTLGMDRVYAERNDQSQGGYGGVKRTVGTPGSHPLRGDYTNPPPPGRGTPAHSSSRSNP